MPAKFEGRDKVMARLRRLVPDAEKEIAAAQAEGAQELAAAIRARVPRKTGELAASIEADLLSNRPGEKPVGGIQQTKDKNAQGIFALYIWRFLEWGTKAGTYGSRVTDKSGRTRKVARDHPGTRAQPFIFPTYRAMRKKIRRKVATAVNKAVRRAKG